MKSSFESFFHGLEQRHRARCKRIARTAQTNLSSFLLICLVLRWGTYQPDVHFQGGSTKLISLSNEITFSYIYTSIVLNVNLKLIS